MSEQSHDSRYRLTDKGKQACLQMHFEGMECDHVYELVKRGVLGCIKCPYEYKLSRSSVSAGGWNGKH
jgi:hypothetical protein